MKKITALMLGLFLASAIAHGQEMTPKYIPSNKISLYARFCGIGIKSGIEECKWVLITSNELDEAFNPIVCATRALSAIRGFQENYPLYMDKTIRSWKCVPGNDPPDNRV
jgi:hypothetical protein